MAGGGYQRVTDDEDAMDVDQVRRALAWSAPSPLRPSPGVSRRGSRHRHSSTRIAAAATPQTPATAKEVELIVFARTLFTKEVRLSGDQPPARCAPCGAGNAPSVRG